MLVPCWGGGVCLCTLQVSVGRARVGVLTPKRGCAQAAPFHRTLKALPLAAVPRGVEPGSRRRGRAAAPRRFPRRPGGGNAPSAAGCSRGRGEQERKRPKPGLARWVLREMGAFPRGKGACAGGASIPGLVWGVLPVPAWSSGVSGLGLAPHPLAVLGLVL